MTPNTRPASSPHALPPTDGLSPAGASQRSRLAAAAALAALTFVVYLPSLSNGFVDYDDHHYVGANPVTQKGITREGIVWAFTTTKFSNWLPVTWLSHMLDCELFGTGPRGHHASSAALHAFNAAVLYLALGVLTARQWASLVVAALFALHPLRVESVSWVAERKDVLCGTFFVLALAAYARYCRRPSAWRLGLVAACQALGLMSKTMLVTLPCVLLLLDYWPLRRLGLGTEPSTGDGASQFPPRPIGRLLLEKLPLFALSAVSCAWTVVLQSDGGAMWGTRHLTLSERAGNAVVSVVRYVWAVVWPANLSVFYPHPGRWPAWQIAAATAVVLAATGAAAYALRRRPYVGVGWLWFVGMLVPVCGLVQVGLQSMADRYTYLPAIGLLLVSVFGAADLVRNRPKLRALAGVGAVAAMLALSVGTWRQQKHWANTFTLFDRALAVDENNWLGHKMVGLVYASNGERMIAHSNRAAGLQLHSRAAAHLERSVRLNPDHYLSWHNYGWSLYRLGRPLEAAEAYRRSIAQWAHFAPSHLCLALALADLGRWEEATPEFEHAARLQSRPADVHAEWGEALLKHGRDGEAAARLAEALRIDPGHSGAKKLLTAASTPAPQVPSVAATEPGK